METHDSEFAEAGGHGGQLPPPESVGMLGQAPKYGVDLGEIGYKAYGEYTGYKTFDGRDMPRWEGVAERTQRCWRVAGERIQQAVLSHGPLNPDHVDCQLCGIIAHQ